MLDPTGYRASQLVARQRRPQYCLNELTAPYGFAYGGCQPKGVTMGRTIRSMCWLAALGVVMASSSLAQPLDSAGAAREPRACVLPPQAPYQGRSLWNANLWPGGVVPYEFDSNTTGAQQ